MIKFYFFLTFLKSLELIREESKHQALIDQIEWMDKISVSSKISKLRCLYQIKHTVFESRQKCPW